MRRIGASGSGIAAWGLRTIPLAIRVEPRETSSEGWSDGWISGGCGANIGSDFSAAIRNRQAAAHARELRRCQYSRYHRRRKGRGQPFRARSCPAVHRRKRRQLQDLRRQLHTPASRASAAVSGTSAITSTASAVITTDSAVSAIAGLPSAASVSVFRVGRLQRLHSGGKHVI